MVNRSKNDPNRQQRIAEAAFEILADQGVEALTFRAVAEKAGVPLGSTSYYFSSREDLISVAVKSFYTNTSALFLNLLNGFVSEYGEVGGLAMLVEEMTVRRRDELRRDYRVYFLLLDRSELLAQTPGWDFHSLLAPFFAPTKARALAFMFEGMLLDSVMYDHQHSFAEAYAIIGSAFVNDAPGFVPE